MPNTAERPILGVSAAEAGEILGISELAVTRLVARGVLHKRVRYQHRGLDLDEVERLALERRKRGLSYWLTTTEVAELLNVSRPAVRKMVATGRLPAPVEHKGRHYYRRQQVEVIANARAGRRLMQSPSR